MQDTEFEIEIISLTVKSDSDLFDILLERMTDAAENDEVYIEEPSEIILENSTG